GLIDSRGGTLRRGLPGDAACPGRAAAFRNRAEASARLPAGSRARARIDRGRAAASAAQAGRGQPCEGDGTFARDRRSARSGAHLVIAERVAAFPAEASLTLGRCRPLETPLKPQVELESST